MDWLESLQHLKDSMPGDNAKPSDNSPSSTSATSPTSATSASAARSSVTLFYERKGRGGKAVTILADFSPEISDDELQSLASRLKQRLGTGGSARGGEILIQGDRREALRPLLISLGYRVKG